KAKKRLCLMITPLKPPFCIAEHHRIGNRFRAATKITHPLGKAITLFPLLFTHAMQPMKDREPRPATIRRKEAIFFPKPVRQFTQLQIVPERKPEHAQKKHEKKGTAHPANQG